jgi:predicted dehydrogenase
MKEYSRRDLLTASLKGTVLAGVGAGGSRARAANDRVNMAFIGLGLRGIPLIREFAAHSSCVIAAVCDVQQSARERAAALAVELQGHAPKVYSDLREVYANPGIDAVCIATPNHWHALATIWACQAGKHVYVEKPASHNMWEGRQMIAAARKYRRVVQVGSQGRSMSGKRRAMELLHSGVIGQVYMAKGICFKRRPSIGHTPNAPVPPGLDWDLFLGPAPMRPYSENRYRYNWHWFWDTGNGDVGNQGAHELDVARWGLNKPGLPNSVVATGGKFVYKDDQETPNTLLACFDYGDCQLQFEVRGLPTGSEGQLSMSQVGTIGNLFFGSEGWMSVSGDSFQIYKGPSSEKMTDDQRPERVRPAAPPHAGNFLAAVLACDPGQLTADVEVGVTSASLAHLANISYRLGGRKLTFDPQAWAFPGDPKADALLTREYRAPYRVPAKV